MVGRMLVTEVVQGHWTEDWIDNYSDEIQKGSVVRHPTATLEVARLDPLLDALS